MAAESKPISLHPLPEALPGNERPRAGHDPKPPRSQRRPRKGSNKEGVIVWRR
jgi:hypothetical protein